MKEMDHSSLPEPPPPLACVSILAIIGVYLLICYLVIHVTDQTDSAGGSGGGSHQPTSLRLSREVLQDITCFYDEKLRYESTCAICLDSLRNAELCRAFPPCNHVFHAQCLDPWLASHFTCPTCRAALQVNLVLYTSCTQQQEQPTIYPS